MARKPINHKRHWTPPVVAWNKAAHEDDVRQAKPDIEARRRDRTWSDRVSDTSRVYDAVTRIPQGHPHKQPVCDVGHTHSVTQSGNSAIMWDEATKRWVPNTRVYEPSPPVRKLVHVVRGGQSGNRQRGGSV